jgi:gas vesicle protein
MEQELSMKRVVNLFFGAVIGGLLAALVVLLLTPSSGPEYRDRLRSFMDKWTTEIRSAADQKRLELEEELSKLRSAKS